MDPYGLEPGSMAPWNEYRLEAGPIASALLARAGIDLETVNAIWLRWFSEPLSDCVGKARAERFVTDLNDLVSR